MADRIPCHGVRLMCRIQLEEKPESHECKQAGRCIFAPSAPDEPKVHCHVCPATPEEHCERNCLDVIAAQVGGALGDYAKEAAAMLRRWPNGVMPTETPGDFDSWVATYFSTPPVGDDMRRARDAYESARRIAGVKEDGNA